MKLPFGVKLLIGFHVFCVVTWIIGQGGAVVAYDFVAKYGFQKDRRENVDPIIILVNQGIGLADILTQLPLFIIGIIGLRKMKFYGAMASWMSFGQHVYWTTVAWCKDTYCLNAGVRIEPFSTGLNLTLATIFLVSVWGTFYLYKNRNFFK